MYPHEVYLADTPKVTADGQVLLMVNEHVFIGVGVRGKRLYKVNTRRLLVDDNALKKNFLKMRMGDDIELSVNV